MLKIENLEKNYNSFKLNCSFEVNEGNITGLIGKNGSGKTTTFKAILGLIKTDSGNINIFGKDIKVIGEEDKEKLGVVLADSGFSGYLTINDIIPILESLYRKFNKDFFIEEVKKFELPFDKKIKEFNRNEG